MTREERDEIVLKLLNERPEAPKTRKRTERPADAKTPAEPKVEKKTAKPKPTTAPEKGN